MQLVEVFRARIVDLAPDSLTIEITGGEDKIDGLLEVLRPYGVLEMARTGRLAMTRASRAASRSASPRRPPTRTIRRFRIRLISDDSQFPTSDSASGDDSLAFERFSSGVGELRLGVDETEDRSHRWQAPE